MLLTSQYLINGAFVTLCNYFTYVGSIRGLHLTYTESGFDLPEANTLLSCGFDENSRLSTKHHKEEHMLLLKVRTTDKI